MTSPKSGSVSPHFEDNNHQHESIRNIIASNFKQAPYSLTSSTSSSPSMPSSTPMNRKKSNSISNGVLARSKSNYKKVSFSNYNSKNASEIFDSESDDSEGYSSEEQEEEKELKKYDSNGVLLRKLNYKESMKKMNKPIRRRYYGGANLEISKSLDSQIMDSNDSVNSSYTNLPAFNKRPLTDTPIVSTMGSPVGQSEDEPETIEEEEEEPNDEQKSIQKNISDLSLSDMGKDSNSSNMGKDPNSSNMEKDSNSSNTEKDSNSSNMGKEQRKASVAMAGAAMVAPQENRASSGLKRPSLHQSYTSPLKPTLVVDDDESKTSGSVSPMSLDKNAIHMNKNIKEHLLKDVPPHMKEQFEKTPSLEKLKNLLLIKPPPSARKTYTLNIPGQTSSKTSPDGKIAQVDVGSKLVIVMVGLPARGKSYITNKLTRYLNWLQHDCRVFNVGNTRRKDKLNAGPEKNPLPDSHTPERSPKQHDASFFNPENQASNILREKWAMDTLEQLLDYVINGSGSVGIFDATNSTKARRKRVLKRIQERSNGELKVLYLESVCSDPSIIESNIRLKLSGPDYKDMDPELALKDFVGRLINYEKAYETIDEEEEKIPGFQYVKMIDVGKKVVSYNIQGFLSSQTVYFLLNFNLCERQIWITRHGESKDNLNGRIGGDSSLTKRGQKFAKSLSKFMNFQRQEFRKQQLERFSSRLELKYNSIFNENDVATLDSIPNEPNFCVWTSMLVRSIETGHYFNDQLYSIKQMRMLNELGGGKFEGMTYDEIQQKYPKEFKARIENKLSYRYPGVGGESYLDVLTRLRPLITEIERTTDHVLIVSHRVVLRILLAYFLNLDKSNIGELDVPLHTLYCLESKPYGTDYTMYEYDEKSDWFKEVQPEHQKNIKEVGVVFKERKYSVVPTAPPSSKQRKSMHHPLPTADDEQENDEDFSLRRSLSFGYSHLPNNQPTLSVTDDSISKNLHKKRNPNLPGK